METSSFLTRRLPLAQVEGRRLWLPSKISTKLGSVNLRPRPASPQAAISSVPRFPLRRIAPLVVLAALLCPRFPQTSPDISSGCEEDEPEKMVSVRWFYRIEELDAAARAAAKPLPGEV